MPPLGVGGFSLLLVPKFPPCIRHPGGCFQPGHPERNTASNGAGNDQSIKPSKQNDATDAAESSKAGLLEDEKIDMVSLAATC